MPPVSKVELCAAIRWDARARMSGRAMERKHGVGRCDLDRFAFLLGGNDGERLLEPGQS